MDEPTLNLTYFIYKDMMDPEKKGILTIDRREHACWHYYQIAMRAMLKTGRGPEDQILYDDQEWRTNRFASQAWAVAKLYQLDDPSEFLKCFPLINRQARLLGLPEAHPEITTPRPKPEEGTLQ
jgi:hypothetical protein